MQIERIKAEQNIKMSINDEYEKINKTCKKQKEEIKKSQEEISNLKSRINSLEEKKKEYAASSQK